MKRVWMCCAWTGIGVALLVVAKAMGLRFEGPWYTQLLAISSFAAGGSAVRVLFEGRDA